MRTERGGSEVENWERQGREERDAEREAPRRFLRNDLRRRLTVRGSSGAVLSHLTHAAQSMQAARDLAADAGLEVAEQVIAHASVFIASSINAVTQPLEVHAGGVLQPPVKITKPTQPTKGGAA